MGKDLRNHKGIMISVIIPYTDGDETRRSAFKTTLDCIKNQTYKDFELIIVEMLFTEPTKLNIENCRHIIVRYENLEGKKKEDTKFNKSWCVNVGVRNSNYDHCLMLDADISFPNNYFEQLVDYSNENKYQFFMGFENLIISKGRDNPEERLRSYKIAKMAGVSWFVEKKFFKDIGAMNESYFGYGAEDNDFWERANFVLREIYALPVNITHIYHHWHPKESNFPLNTERIEIFNQVKHNIPEAIDKLQHCNWGSKKPQRIYF